MAGFTKLQSSMINSTVWRAPDHVRLLWVTMLCMCDKNGNVESSIPGLADAARISLDRCINGLEHLSNPDQYSRSKEHEGRRIKEVDGGWLLLNYIKYRGMLTKEKIRDQTRDRVKKHRERNATVTQVTQCNASNASNAQSEAYAESEAESGPKAREEKKAKNKQKRNSGYSANFESWWKVYPKKRNKPGAWKAWKANLTNLASIERMLHNLDIQSKSWDWTQEGGQYIPYPASYLNAHGWNDNLQASPAAAPKSRQQTEHDRQMQIIADGLKDDEPEPKIIECEVR